MAITTINTVLREIIVKLQDEHFNFQSEDIDLKIIFETLHVWLEDMRGDPGVDMMDVYRAMIFVGLVNFIYLQFIPNVYAALCLLSTPRTFV